MIVLRLINESLLFALRAIGMNKTRTMLSLLGITIGIFSVITVFTIFDSMENSIKKSIDSLGNNILFVTKWPWSMDLSDEYPWWKYYKRPEPRIVDMQEIQKRSGLAEAVSFMVATNKTVKYLNNSMKDIPIVGISQDYNRVLPFDLGSGRYFTPLESQSGRSVAIIGAKIADNLYKNMDPVGRKIKIFGINLEVIGVLKREGEDFFKNSSDNQVFIPIKFARNYIDFENVGTNIVVKAKPYVTNDELTDELKGILRSVRKIKPSAEDDFSINEMSIVQKGFDSLFSVIATVGWIIGGFSLLVGGFGIANIMFVSVKERTSQIGIQMALGAKKYFILLQFLFEAIFLSLIGGLAGLLIIYAGTIIMSQGFGMELVLTRGNIMLGIFVSSLIGLVSGFFPAFRASRLDPVEAMRSTF